MGVDHWVQPDVNLPAMILSPDSMSMRDSSLDAMPAFQTGIQAAKTLYQEISIDQSTVSRDNPFRYGFTQSSGVASLKTWSRGHNQPHAAGFHQFLSELGGEGYLSSLLRTSGGRRKARVPFKAVATCVH